MPPLDVRTRIRLYPLVVREEDGEYVIGRIDTGEFVALPELGKHAIELLNSHRTLAEVTSLLEREHGEAVDLAEFVEQLIDLGFVESVDGATLDRGERFRPTLPWLRAERVRWVFTWPVAAGYAMLLTTAAIMLTTNPDLLPTYRKFFWGPRTSIVIAANTAMFLGVMAVHEFAHLAAARSLAVPARITFGTRLYSLVAQTEAPALWALPKRQRYRVYLIGMASDLGLLALALIVANTVPTLRRLFEALAVILVIGLVSQLQLYMRTDLYFVLADLAKAKNLYQDAAVYALERVRRAWDRLIGASHEQRADPLASLSDRERSVIRTYAPLMIAGSALALGLYAWYGLPILYRTLLQGIDALRSGLAAGRISDITDGILTLGVEAGLQILFIRQLLRGRRERIRRLRERFG